MIPTFLGRLYPDLKTRKLQTAEFYPEGAPLNRSPRKKARALLLPMRKGGGRQYECDNTDKRGGLVYIVRVATSCVRGSKEDVTL